MATPRGTTLYGVVVCLCVLTSVHAMRAAMPDEDAARELQQIGRTAAAAILRKDSATILSFSRSELKTEQAAAVKDPNDDLYCFLFKPSCPTIGHSVYGILSRAKKLELDVRVFSDEKGGKHGWILFFDATRISRKNLRSIGFLCRHPTDIASWMFDRSDGKWISAHAPFDFETDTLCSPR